MMMDQIVRDMQKDTISLRKALAQVPCKPLRRYTQTAFILLNVTDKPLQYFYFVLSMACLTRGRCRQQDYSYRNRSARGRSPNISGAEGPKLPLQLTRTTLLAMRCASDGLSRYAQRPMPPLFTNPCMRHSCHHCCTQLLNTAVAPFAMHFLSLIYYTWSRPSMYSVAQHFTDSCLP